MATNSNNNNNNNSNEKKNAGTPIGGDREPDELDALLAATAIDNTSSVSRTVAAGASQKGQRRSGTKKLEGSHKKSLTLGPTTYASISSTTNASSSPLPLLDGDQATTTTALLEGRVPRNKSHRKSHRKNKSSISELFLTAVSNRVDLQTIRDDFQRTASAMRSELVEELEDMHDGRTNGFFDMSTTRGLAVLPNDIRRLGEENRHHRFPSFGSGKYTHHLNLDGEKVFLKDNDGDVDLEDITEGDSAEEGDSDSDIDDSTCKGPALGLNSLVLLGAVVSHASNSTALHMLTDVAPTMKLFWRMSASYICLLPFAGRYLYYEGIPKLSVGEWSAFLAATFFYTGMMILFYSALEYTTIGNAVIYANSQAILLIVGKACIGERIHWLEGLGVVVAFSGAIMCSLDSSQESTDHDQEKNAVLGDVLAILSAIFGVGYLTVAKVVRAKMSVTFFITCVMFVGSLMTLACVAASEELTFDMNIYHGVFGGFDLSAPYYRVAVLGYLAIVVNGAGTMGYIRAMQAFDNTVIAVSTLLEPLIASIIAWFFHAGLLPGIEGWIGNLLVVFGTLGVVYPSMGKEEKGIH